MTRTVFAAARVCAFAAFAIFTLVASEASAAPRHHRHHHHHAHHDRVAAAGETQITSHPAGCPTRAFCGCGAAVRVFGGPVRSLWLAASWFKFPRAAPAAGMVAVRRHHVFVLEQHLGGATWLAYDANSGGHATRIHARSIHGYTIVNPHAGLALAWRA